MGTNFFHGMFRITRSNNSESVHVAIAIGARTGLEAEAVDWLVSIYSRKTKQEFRTNLATLAVKKLQVTEYPNLWIYRYICIFKLEH